MIQSSKFPKVHLPRVGGLQPRTREERDFGAGKNQRPKISNKNEDLVLLRLRRIEGQVKAVKRMYEEGNGCDKIIQQVLAVREALGGVAKIILKDQAVKCARKPTNSESLEKSLNNLIKFS